MTAASEIDLDALDGRELVRLFGRVMLALREREIVRSANNPIADIAEQLVGAYYGGSVASPNEPSYDVLAADGRRLQVKALRRSQKGRTTLSPLRSHDFDAVVAGPSSPTLRSRPRSTFRSPSSRSTSAGRTRGRPTDFRSRSAFAPTIESRGSRPAI